MVSERYKTVVSKHYGSLPEYETAPPGLVLHFEWEPQPPLDVEHRYLGKTCILIGPETFSSAMMLANAVEDFELATLIGQPTSSPPNYFGEVYEFPLPNSEITAQSSVAYFVRANGDAAERSPVRPHIFVEPDRSRETDRALEAALRWATATEESAASAGGTR